jgi:hypothetical protein
MRALLLPAAAWRPDGAGAWASGCDVPVAGRVVAWAEGWPAAGALLRAGEAEALFVLLGGTAFAMLEAASGAALVLRAPAPPPACRVVLPVATRHSPTLDGMWPRAIARPAAPPAPGPAARRTLLEAALAAGDLDGALGQMADMLAAARGAPETLDAARLLLGHLARHPFRRSPRLGALAAALTED